MPFALRASNAAPWLTATANCKGIAISLKPKAWRGCPFSKTVTASGLSPEAKIPFESVTSTNPEITGKAETSTLYKVADAADCSCAEAGMTPGIRLMRSSGRKNLRISLR